MFSYFQPTDRNAADLSEKLENFEKVVQNQIKQNQELLDRIKPSIPETHKVVPGPMSDDFANTKIAVLVIACNRSMAVKNLLSQLFK